MDKQTSERASKIYSELKWSYAGSPLSLREKDALWEKAMDKAQYEASKNRKY